MYLPSLMVALLGTFIVACTSSPEVQELAEKTAANTAVLSRVVADVASQSDRLAQQRAANMALLRQQTTEVEARVALDRMLLKQSGDLQALNTLNALKEWSDSVRENEAEAVFEEADFVQGFLARRTALETRSKELSEVAEALAKISQRESTAARAQFLVTYNKTVRDEVKRQKAEAEADAKSGEAKLAETPSAP